MKEIAQPKEKDFQGLLQSWFILLKLISYCISLYWRSPFTFVYQFVHIFKKKIKQKPHASIARVWFQCCWFCVFNISELISCLNFPIKGLRPIQPKMGSTFKVLEKIFIGKSYHPRKKEKWHVLKHFLSDLKIESLWNREAIWAAL